MGKRKKKKFINITLTVNLLTHSLSVDDNVSGLCAARLFKKNEQFKAEARVAQNPCYKHTTKEMKPKTYAKKLVEKYSKYVNGYVGSSMLTNTEYPETIKENAKKCALICIDAILDDVGAKYWEKDEVTKNYYWKEVKKEIEAM